MRPISIVVAAHNEEGSIASTLDDLLRQKERKKNRVENEPARYSLFQVSLHQVKIRHAD